MRCAICHAWMVALSTGWLHRPWCRVPAELRKAKRQRWRRNRAARRRELARLIQAQAADMRRGRWADTQRFGRRRTTSWEKITGHDDGNDYESFPFRVWGEMI